MREDTAMGENGAGKFAPAAREDSAPADRIARRNNTLIQALYLGVAFPGVPYKERGGSFSIGGNIKQMFEWTERSPCCKCGGF